MTEQEFRKLSLSLKRPKKEDTTNWGEILRASQGLGRVSWFDYVSRVGKMADWDEGKLKKQVEAWAKDKNTGISTAYDGHAGMKYEGRKRWKMVSVTS